MKVFEHFREPGADQAAVLIHRFSSVRMAGRFPALADARLGVSGTHAALLAERRHHAELFELQACGYR